MTSVRHGEPDDGQDASDRGYVFDNAREQAASRFRALEAIFDPATKRFMLELGLQPGWRCLEVGAGGGSIAAWLSEQVGRDGHVVATDIDTRHLKQLRLPNTTVRQHDVTRDPLPEGSFDLIHTRLVLIHLPERKLALRRLTAALKQGGWLLVEEFDSLSIRSDSEINPAESSFATLKAMHEVMAGRGVHLRCGRLLAGWLRELGLVDVESEGRLFMWHGGSPGADLMRTNIEQLRPEILASGLVTSSQLEKDLAQLTNDFAFPSPILWSAWGRLP